MNTKIELLGRAHKEQFRDAKEATLVVKHWEIQMTVDHDAARLIEKCLNFALSNFTHEDVNHQAIEEIRTVAQKMETAIEGLRKY